MSTYGEILTAHANAKGIPLQTLSEVENTLRRAKRTKADKAMANAMLKFGRMTDDAREFVKAYAAGE
jgi:hypothetical protein